MMPTYPLFPTLLTPINDLKKTTRRSVRLKSDPETESQVRKRVKQIYKF